MEALKFMSSKPFSRFLFLIISFSNLYIDFITFFSSFFLSVHVITTLSVSAFLTGFPPKFFD